MLTRLVVRKVPLGTTVVKEMKGTTQVLNKLAILYKTDFAL